MSYLSAEKAESELAQSIRKACSVDETAPKQKHVRSKFISRKAHTYTLTFSYDEKNALFIPGTTEALLLFGIS